MRTESGCVTDVAATTTTTTIPTTVSLKHFYCKSAKQEFLRTREMFKEGLCKRVAASKSNG